MTNLTRRNLMKAAAATGLAGVLGSRLAFAADEPLGITLVVPSPIGDVGWGHALSASLEPVKAKYGDKVKVTVLENIMEGPDADRIMTKTVADGNKFLIAGSFGYQNGALQVEVNVDQEHANSLGITAAAVREALQAGFGGSTPATIESTAGSFDVFLDYDGAAHKVASTLTLDTTTVSRLLSYDLTLAQAGTVTLRLVATNAQSPLLSWAAAVSGAYQVGYDLNGATGTPPAAVSGLLWGDTGLVLRA